MINMIKGVDFGMGYEWTSEWGLRNQFHTAEGWVTSACPDQEAMNLEMAKGVFYRRKLPILASRPEAIPLEPGDVLQVGDRGLTRDAKWVDFTLEYWHASGASYAPTKQDIIARLPKVAKEAEKAKEEKVEEDRVQIGTLFPKLADVAKAVIENPKIMAEVKRQEEEAKRISDGDLVVAQGGPIFRARRIVNNQVTGNYVVWIPLDRCRKLNLPPDLISALNAEIDRKAGG